MPLSSSVPTTDQLAEQAKTRKDNGVLGSDILASLAQFWGIMYYGLGALAAVIAAVAGVSAIADNSTLAAVFALVSAFLTSLTTFLHSDSKTQRYRQTSLKYAAVGERADHLLRYDIPNAASERDRRRLQAKLDGLDNELERIRRASPPVPQRKVRAMRAMNHAQGGMSTLGNGLATLRSNVRNVFTLGGRGP
jgi:hypothetical protein